MSFLPGRWLCLLRAQVACNAEYLLLNACSAALNSRLFTTRREVILRAATARVARASMVRSSRCVSAFLAGRLAARRLTRRQHMCPVSMLHTQRGV